MIAAIRDDALEREITRICHFTPSRHLPQIAEDKRGILCTKRLREDERAAFTQTDLQRLDGHSECICCSVEYPNGWYFDTVRGREVLFKDWVVLFVSPDYLWKDGTLFSSRNASAGYGAGVAPGHTAFSRMFASASAGAYGATYTRGPQHLPCSPTDDQAEVLVPDQIGLHDILGVAVSSVDQARNEMARFRLAGVSEETFKIFVAPDLFNKRRLSAMIRSGQRPTERLWKPE